MSSLVMIPHATEGAVVRCLLCGLLVSDFGAGLVLLCSLERTLRGLPPIRC
jgi:hypothetical protein